MEKLEGPTIDVNVVSSDFGQNENSVNKSIGTATTRPISDSNFGQNLNSVDKVIGTATTVPISNSNFGQNENSVDKSIGTATTASISDSLAANVDNEIHSGKDTLRNCSSGIPNPRIHPEEGFKDSKRKPDTDVESAHEAVPNGLEVVPTGVGLDEKKGDVSQRYEFVSDANRDISEKCISLFVEVFGPQDGYTKQDEQVAGGNLESTRSSNQVGLENPSFEVSQNEEEEVALIEDKFLVGDVVWVETTTKSWWPGQIMDPSNISSVAPKPDQRACFVVKHIGNRPIAWYSSKQLKPFAEHFEQFKSQGQSYVFLSAVKKAVDEFGRHRTAEMTQFEPVNFLSLVKSLPWNESKVGMLELAKVQSYLSAFYRSLGHHQLPTNELHENNKHSARGEKYSKSKNMTGDKDTEVVDSNVDREQISEDKSGKASEQRERKRSKYLSYPYTNFNQSCIKSPVLEGGERNDLAVLNSLANPPTVSSPKVNSTMKKLHAKRPRKQTNWPESPITPGDLDGPSVDLLSKLSPALEEDKTNGVAVSTSLANQPSVRSPKVKSTVKKSRTRSPQKPTYQPKLLITPGVLNTPSVDLLAKLRFAALDNSCPGKETDLDLVCGYFSGFRRWVFHEEHNLVVEHKHENGKESKDAGLSRNPIGEKPLTSNSNKVITSRKRRKKVEVSTSSNGKPTPTSSVSNMNGLSGSFEINFGLSASSGLHNLSEPMKGRKRSKEFMEHMQAEIEVVLPGLNGNCTMQSPLIINPHLNHVPTVVKKQVPRKRKQKVGLLGSQTNSGFSEVDVNFSENDSLVENVQVNAMGLDSKAGLKIELPDDQLNDDRSGLKESSLVKEARLMGLLASGTNMHEAKKRKRKEKTPKTNSQSTTIPDLNGNANVSGTIFPEKVVPEMKSATNESEPPKKRGRKKKISPSGADLNPCFSKVFMKEEPLGTALVLTFAQGFPVPSKEVLLATFRGFGLLNESETKGLPDNRSAQVVFRKGSDAVEALKGIEKTSPFGPVLVKCQLRHLSPVTRPTELKTWELKATNAPKEAPNIAHIRKNLEMMTSVLEKGGDNLPAEMRTKLENGIQGLLKKVGTMVGSTSSS